MGLYFSAHWHLGGEELGFRVLGFGFRVGLGWKTAKRALQIWGATEEISKSRGWDKPFVEGLVGNVFTEVSTMPSIYASAGQVVCGHQDAQISRP